MLHSNPYWTCINIKGSYYILSGIYAHCLHQACISIIGLADDGPAAMSDVIRIGDQVLSVDGWAVRAHTSGVTCHQVMVRIT
jgi:C-terminal processing protease CtpA/Prc